MNTNDAAETLAWHEERRKQWGERARKDYAASQQKAMGESWKPVLTPEQQAAHNEYVRVHQLPF